MQERFIPKCKRELYQTEFQTRRKQKTEGWADYAEDFKILVDKAFPDLQEEARDLLAMNQFLNQPDSPQVAFSVKQSRPTKSEEAVVATFEMESFVRPKAARVVQIEQGGDPVASVTKKLFQHPYVYDEADDGESGETRTKLVSSNGGRDRNVRRVPPTQERNALCFQRK